jgi:hypothetical protein
MEERTMREREYSRNEGWKRGREYSRERDGRENGEGEGVDQGWKRGREYIRGEEGKKGKEYL